MLTCLGLVLAGRQDGRSGRSLFRRFLPGVLSRRWFLPKGLRDTMQGLFLGKQAHEHEDAAGVKGGEAGHHGN